jgi:hypothetical protein
VSKQRRVVLKLSIVAAADAIVGAVALVILGSRSSAIAYAESVTDAIRKGATVSPVRNSIAKQAIEKHLAENENDPELLKAYAQVNAAERYYEVQMSRLDVQMIAASYLETPIRIDKSITMRGSTKRLPVAVGPMESMFIVSQGAFTLESFSFLAVTKPAPSIFQFAGQPEVVVRDCSFTGFHQSLDSVTWIDVDFQDCILESALPNLTLVNVSFRNCILPPALARLQSPVTFSSRT